MRCHAARLILATLLSLVAIGPARADLYRWVDDADVTHYTSDPGRVPRAYRATVVRVEDAPIPPPARSGPFVPSGWPRPPAPESRPSGPPADAPAIVEPEVMNDPTVLPAPEARVPDAPTEPDAPAVLEALPETAPDAVEPPAPETQVAPIAEPTLAHPVKPELPPVEQEPPVATELPVVLEPMPAPALRDAALPDAQPTELPEDVAELERMIEADREELRRLIGESQWEGTELANDPRLRELAERLPRLQAQLEALRGETLR